MPRISRREGSSSTTRMRVGIGGMLVGVGNRPSLPGKPGSLALAAVDGCALRNRLEHEADASARIPLERLRYPAEIALGRLDLEHVPAGLLQVDHEDAALGLLVEEVDLRTGLARARDRPELGVGRGLGDCLGL